MSQSEQQPAIHTTNSLYAQRKAQYPMPTALKQQVLASGKTQLKQSKPTYWLQPTIWAASCAALLTVVLSVQMLPKKTQMQPQTQSDVTRKAEPQMQKVAEQPDVVTLSEATYDAAQPESQAYAPSAEQPSTGHHQELTRAAPAPQPARLAQATNESEIWVNGAVVVRARLQPKVEGQPRQVKDCYGTITMLTAQNLDAFEDGQWLDIHYFEDGTIMRILKTAKQNQHCP